MKKIVSLVLCCSFLTAMECTSDRDDFHHHIFFCNNGNYATYVDISYKHPDTAIQRDPTIPGWHKKTEPHRTNEDALTNASSYEGDFSSHLMDTLIIFVFNADTATLQGWEYVKDHNLVTQRYDLSLSDLQNLNWSLTFPPTEEMRNIKMWPPYGTYDEHGNRLK